MDQNPQHRRHYPHRRRAQDRRPHDQRVQTPEAGGREPDVEQIMRDIRARISQRTGIDLSPQQVQELAARRLESILDPRTLPATLIDQLKRGAGTVPDLGSSGSDLQYGFEDTTLYASHRGVLRFLRRLLNPVLKLFFNPNPLIHALHTQSRLNAAAAERELERDRRQAEWNALHYEILNRLVTEVARLSIEATSLSGRVESLAARVDFADRRVRAMENDIQQSRPAPRAEEAPSAGGVDVSEAAAGDPSSAEGARRRRRRRRGRRGGGEPEGGRPREVRPPGAIGSGAAAEGTVPVETSRTTAPAGADVAETLPAAEADSTSPPLHQSPPRDEPSPEAQPDAPDPAPTDR